VPPDREEGQGEGKLGQMPRGFCAKIGFRGEATMKITDETLEKVVSIAKRYGATRLVLFGSAAHSPENIRDLDIACDGIEGWELFGFAAHVEEELGVPLDVVPLSPPTRFTRYIESKGKVLL